MAGIIRDIEGIMLRVLIYHYDWYCVISKSLSSEVVHRVAGYSDVYVRRCGAEKDAIHQNSHLGFSETFFATALRCGFNISHFFSSTCYSEGKKSCKTNSYEPANVCLRTQPRPFFSVFPSLPPSLSALLRFRRVSAACCVSLSVALKLWT